MIVKNLEELLGGPRDVDWGNGQSRRFLIESDNMQFSLTDTVVNAGSRSLLEYKNHLEACYCIQGIGEIEDTVTKRSYPLVPGTMYALDRHDKHYLVAKTQMRLVCVFLPALKGHESHRLNPQGSSSY